MAGRAFSVCDIHQGWAVCVAGAVLTFTVPARAKECPHGEIRVDPDGTERCLPRNIEPESRLAVGGALGSCRQDDPLVGGSWICGELTAGVSLVMPWRLRVLLEAGVGSTVRQSWGYPTYGLGEASGGPYVVPRALLGYDWTTLFFTAVGVQARVADPYHQILHDGSGGPLQYVSVQGLFEAGTSVFSQDIEVALRVGVGQERIFSQAPEVGNWSNGVLAFDTFLVGRWLLPPFSP